MKAKLSLLIATALGAAAVLTPIHGGQPPKDPAGDIRELKLRDWEPKSMMVTKTRLVEKPLYPVIDVHNHLGGGKERLTPATVKRYLTEMDEAGVKTVVNLDGGWGDRLKETLAALDEAHPDRFLTFALVNFADIDDKDWGAREAQRLEESFKAGAKGLKFHKSLGLGYKFKDGTLMTVDSPKLDPVWEACAKHGRPVVIHVADPAAFFTPLDRFNERWHELNRNPNWLFADRDRFPQRQELLDQLHRVIAKHPKTTFINTHFGNNAEDLASVADKLDKYPNMYVDIDARISELGRQPYTARKFFLKYQNRIMFGTDTTPRREAYRTYYRFLETEDEYFDCSASHHRQGFWNIYGINLPPEVLDKVYRKNAERVLFGIKPNPDRPGPRELKVPATEDFEVTGDGSAKAWEKAAWEPLHKRNANGLPYEARFKALYSKKGLYVLLDGTDKKLTATFKTIKEATAAPAASSWSSRRSLRANRLKIGGASMCLNPPLVNQFGFSSPPPCDHLYKRHFSNSSKSAARSHASGPELFKSDWSTRRRSATTRSVGRRTSARNTGSDASWSESRSATRNSPSHETFTSGAAISRPTGGPDTWRSRTSRTKFSTAT
jgi:predicted TIM-barrel fold metal-dependent hydrolase